MHCINCGIPTTTRWCDDCRPEANESTAYIQAQARLMALETIQTIGEVQAGQRAATLRAQLNDTRGPRHRELALGLWAQLEEWELRP